MRGREQHLRSADRFEQFLKQIDHNQQQHREWVVIVMFHIAMHYVDAFLATKMSQVTAHGDRWAKMASLPETRVLGATMMTLYNDAKEARYEGGEYAPLDLGPIRKRYLTVRTAMRSALGLPP